jgi:hypothetical protein
MSKQDRQGVRTPADLERKYGLGKLDENFANIMGIALGARDSVERIQSDLRSEFSEQMTSFTRDTERIMLTALESYVETGDYEEYKKTVQSELNVLADKVTINFNTTTEKLSEVDETLQGVTEDINKSFEFTADGLAIKAGENAMSLVLDNDVIRFVKNGEEYGWWDGVDFHTGNIVVALDERAQIGNYAFVPRSDGSLDFLKVGG